MRPSFVWLSVALAANVAGCAATGLPDKPVVKNYELSQTVFDRPSGLKVIVQEDHSAPVATVVVAYAVGATSDPKGVEGLAHVVEHMMFRAQPGGEQVWDHLKRMGASFNAFTSEDMTVYFETAHKDNLNSMMQLEAWRMLRALEGVTPEVFKTEREVVRNELRQGGETEVGGKLFDTLLRQLFPTSHPLSRSIIGTHESLCAATLEHARAFTAQHYKPQNCTVVISGDVDTDEVKKLLGMWPAELLFGPGGPGGGAVPPHKSVSEKATISVPPPASTELTRHKGPVEQPLLLLAWSAPGGHRGNDGLLAFAASRLNLALAEGLAPHLAYDDDIEGAGAFVMPFADASVFMVQVNLRPGANPEKARTRVLDTLVNAWITELGTLQTESSRWGAATNLLLQTASPEGLATELAVYASNTGQTAYFKNTLEELAAIKPGQIMDFAHQWLTRERAASVYFEPENDEAPRLVAGAGGSAKSGGGQRSHELGVGATGTPQGLGADRIREVARSPRLAALARFKLANGLEVVTAPHGTAPVAQIVVGIRGGDAHTQPYGLSNFATMFAQSKCRNYGDLEPVGGQIGWGSGVTRTTAFVEVMSGNLANGIAVLSDKIGCMEASDERFLMRDRVIELQGRFLDRAAKMPDFLATKRFMAELYPGHPYGVVAPDPGALKAITFENVAAYLRNHFRPENAIAVVVGDVNPRETRELAEKYLSQWSGGGSSAAMSLDPGAGPKGRKVFLVDRPGGTQATTRIGCRLPESSAEKVPAYDLLEALVNERAWSIREQYGATYGMHAAVDLLPGRAAHLALSGAIVNKQAGVSIAKLLDLLAGLATDGLDERTFLLKRWDVAREFSARLHTGKQIASAILQASEHGWPIEVWDEYGGRLAATTADDIRALLKPCIGHEIVSIAGDAATLRPQLLAAGLTLESE